MLIGERKSITNKPQLDDYEKVLFIGFGYDKDNLIDTLSIKSVNRAKLLGMCIEDPKLYKDARKHYNIDIRRHETIEDFLNTNL